MAYLEELQRTWDEFGQTDPFWSILTHPDKKGNKWDLDDFFQTGKKEINALLAHLETLRLPLRKEKALDFGCGVGRLTQALACHFHVVEGVDIAPSMIELANKLNHYGDRCKFHLNAKADLSLFDDETFDFIYTNIVLQHMEPAYSKKYLGEFLRVLVPDGVLVFKITSTARTLRASSTSTCTIQL